jgi:hypothetical protein
MFAAHALEKCAIFKQFWLAGFLTENQRMLKRRYLGLLLFQKTQTSPHNITGCSEAPGLYVLLDEIGEMVIE